MSTRVYQHPFHLVDGSPWPFLGSLSSLGLTVGTVGYMHYYSLGIYLLFLGLIGVLWTMIVWWRDVIRESTFEGRHTTRVQAGLRLGVLLFIISEIMFFFSFFWGYFHSSLSPTIELGQCWPPHGISVLSAWGVPLLNTAILLTSGATITACHHSLIWGSRSQSVLYLGLTVFLGVFFLSLQAFEYINAPFTISDSTYGSIFFLTTGFHGLHVIIGTIFLWVCFLRLRADHFTRTHHIGFESAAYYWHMVDVVWLFLFLAVYWWGGVTEGN